MAVMTAAHRRRGGGGGGDVAVTMAAKARGGREVGWSVVIPGHSDGGTRVQEGVVTWLRKRRRHAGGRLMVTWP